MEKLDILLLKTKQFQKESTVSSGFNEIATLKAFRANINPFVSTFV